MFLRFVKYSDNTGIIVLYSDTFWSVFCRFTKSCLTWQWLAFMVTWHILQKAIWLNTRQKLFDLCSNWYQGKLRYILNLLNPVSTDHHEIWISDKDKRSIFNYFLYLFDVTWFTCFMIIIYSCWLIFKFPRFFLWKLNDVIGLINFPDNSFFNIRDTEK